LERKRRWCGSCAKDHAGAVDIIAKMCEGCKTKHPSYGLPSDGKRGRWCLKCSKAHPGAVDVVNAKCEVCKLKQPAFGILADGKKRWCATCASAHPAWGAVRIPPKSGFKKSPSGHGRGRPRKTDEPKKKKASRLGNRVMKK
jgi:hypothetical protein